MWTQCLALAIIAGVVWRSLSKLYGHMPTLAGGGHEDETQYLGRLANFVPVGLAIGIMSPVSMLLVRGLLSGTLSWDEVGYLQALLRSTEWVTATAAGVLSLVFLPRFSATYDTSRFKLELMRAGLIVLLPAACLLLLAYFNQRTMLATLYDSRFMVSDTTAALFMLGSWIRIASSLPLYALLLWLSGAAMTLDHAALLYLVSYLVYLSFTAASLLFSMRKKYS
jgi:PST family polysaccharide transporter